MNTMSEALGVVVLPVHHFGKAAETGLRGASAWRAGCDTELSVLADRDQTTGACSNRRIALTKSHVGEEGWVARFELRFVALDEDEDGEEFGACYVEQGRNDDDTSIISKPKEKGPPRAAKVYLDAFAEPAIFTGTGFFVAADGSLVTNAHVVENCASPRVRLDGAVNSAQIIARDTTNDLALLHTSATPTAIARLRSPVRLGESVAAFGFPYTDVLTSSGNFTVGNVTASRGLGDDNRHIQFSAPVQSGNSGGPLLDTTSNVVGVVVGKLDALKVVMRDGDLPQNVNFAIKADILMPFLDANHVHYAKSAGPLRSLDAPDLASAASAISAFVVCVQR